MVIFHDNHASLSSQIITVGAVKFISFILKIRFLQMAACIFA